MLASAAIATAACGRPAPDAPRLVASTDRVAVWLVGAVEAQGEGPARVLRRVVVVHDRTDTIPGLLTTDAPAIVGDTAVLGLAVEADGTPTGMFRYRIASGLLVQLGMPETLALGATGVAVAPGGRWITYAEVDTAGWVQPIIQRFPNGPVLRRGPAMLGAAVGGRVAEAEWSDSTVAVVTADAFGDGSGRRLRFRGDVLAGKWRVDTVDVAPAP